MDVAEYILELSNGLGMLVTWIHLDRALLGKTLTVRFKAEWKKLKQNVLNFGNSPNCGEVVVLLVLYSLTNAHNADMSRPDL